MFEGRSLNMKQLVLKKIISGVVTLFLMASMPLPVSNVSSLPSHLAPYSGVPATSLSLISTPFSLPEELEVVSTKIPVRKVKSNSVSVARLVNRGYRNETNNVELIQAFTERFRGGNWFEAFQRGYELYYFLLLDDDGVAQQLYEFRGAASDKKSLVQTDSLFIDRDQSIYPDEFQLVAPSVELRVWNLNDARRKRFEELSEAFVAEEGARSEKRRGSSKTGENGYKLIQSASIHRHSLPLPLQGIDFKEVRDLGNDLRAYLPRIGNKVYFHELVYNRVIELELETEEKKIVISDEESGEEKEIVKHVAKRVLSRPLYVLENDTQKQHYSELLYNILAKIHNATGKTPKIWDPILIELQKKADKKQFDLALDNILSKMGREAVNVRTILIDSKFSRDEKVKLVSERVPDQWESVRPLLIKFLDQKEKSQQNGTEFSLDLVELVDLIHDQRGTTPPTRKDPSFISEIQKEAHNTAILYDQWNPMSPTLLARLTESQNLAPMMIIGLKQKKAKDELHPRALWRSLIHGDYGYLFKDSDWVEFSEEGYGYILLNGKKIWVFRNLDMISTLIIEGKLPPEFLQEAAKIRKLIGPNIFVNEKEVSLQQPGASAYTKVLSSDIIDKMRLLFGIDETDSVQSYSQLELIEKPTRNHSAVDSRLTAKKVRPEDQHFKQPHTSYRFLNRLIYLIEKSDQTPFTFNSVRTTRLDSQLGQSGILDATREGAAASVIRSFPPVYATDIQNRSRELIPDVARLLGRKYHIDSVQGTFTNDKTASRYEVTLDVSAVSLTQPDIISFFRHIAEHRADDLGDFTIHDYKIQGKHVRGKSGVHFSVKDIEIVPIDNSDTKKVKLKFWFDRDWEQAGELIHMAETVPNSFIEYGKGPESNDLDADRDLLRDLLYNRGTIPPQRERFPYFEFASEAAPAILEAANGRIGRRILAAKEGNLPSTEEFGVVPLFELGHFNQKLVGLVGANSVQDMLYGDDRDKDGVAADGTFGVWDADLEYGEGAHPSWDLNRSDRKWILGWVRVNGADPIPLIKSKQGKSYLKRGAIHYGAVLPTANLTERQKRWLMLLSTSGSDVDNLADAMGERTIDSVQVPPAIRRVMAPQPWKKVKAGDGKESAIYNITNARELWRKALTLSPCSCTTNGGIFGVFVHELMFNLQATLEGGTDFFTPDVLNGIETYFKDFWDDFPKAFKINAEDSLYTQLEEGQAWTIHAPTNTQSIRNSSTGPYFDSGKFADAKALDKDGINDTSSGVSKSVARILPNAVSLNTRSLRVPGLTGSVYIINQPVTLDNLRTDLNQDEKKALQAYFKKKFVEAYRYAAENMFNGSMRTAPLWEVPNSHSIRGLNTTSIFEEQNFELEIVMQDGQYNKSAGLTFKSRLWYDNEGGFSEQVLGLWDELAHAIDLEEGTTIADSAYPEGGSGKDGSNPVSPDSPEQVYSARLDAAARGNQVEFSI